MSSREVYWNRDAAVLAAFRALAKAVPDKETTLDNMLHAADVLADTYGRYEGGLSMEDFAREALGTWLRW